MNIPMLFAAGIALVIITVPFESKDKDPEFKPPETEEKAGVDQANAKLDDFANAQLKLINQRMEALNEYVKQATAN